MSQARAIQSLDGALAHAVPDADRAAGRTVGCASAAARTDVRRGAVAVALRVLHPARWRRSSTISATEEPFTLGLEEELFVVDPARRAAAQRRRRRARAARRARPRRGQERASPQPDRAHHRRLRLGRRGGRRAVRPARRGPRDGRRPDRLRHAPDRPSRAIRPSPTARATSASSGWLGDAGATPVCALHIHVGMPDAQTAIRVFNGLRRHLPLLEALGANSPFRHGRDTGLASSRELTLRSWPRAGVPRAMARLRRLRPLDGAADPRRRGARLHVSLVEAATASAARDRRDPRAGHAGLAAAHRRAGRSRARARAPRGAGRCRGTGRPRRSSTRPRSAPGAQGVAARRCRTTTTGCGRSRELLEELVERIRPAARELRCEHQLDALAALLDAGGGAGVQRAAYGDGDFPALLRTLVADACASARARAIRGLSALRWRPAFEIARRARLPCVSQG